MTQNTNIIYLTGKPGVSKYTIAKELASKHDVIVCDKQLVNNPIFELLQYEGYAIITDLAWDAIGNISGRWKSIDAHDVYDETPRLSISHPNSLELNASNLSSVNPAQTIMSYMKGLTS